MQHRDCEYFRWENSNGWGKCVRNEGDCPVKYMSDEACQIREAEMAHDKAEKLHIAVKDANEMCRSAMSIAEREGKTLTGLHLGGSSRNRLKDSIKFYSLSSMWIEEREAMEKDPERSMEELQCQNCLLAGAHQYADNYGVPSE